MFKVKYLEILHFDKSFRIMFGFDACFCLQGNGITISYKHDDNAQPNQYNDYRVYMVEVSFELYALGYACIANWLCWPGL